MKPKILISVPHSDCRKDKPWSRKCDRRAESAAQMFHSLLDSTKFLHINHSVPRSTMDMNRTVARSTPWRKALTHQMSDAQWLLDFHSFPPTEKWHHNDEQVFLEFLFDEPTRPAWLDDLVAQLRVLSPHIYADHGVHNDILDEFLHKKLSRSLLVEVNEDVSRLSDTKLKALLQKLAEFVSQ